MMGGYGDASVWTARVQNALVCSSDFVLERKSCIFEAERGVSSGFPP